MSSPSSLRRLSSSIAVFVVVPCDRLSRSSLLRSSLLQPPKTRLVVACSLASLVLRRRLMRSMGGDDPFVLLLTLAAMAAHPGSRSRPAPKKLNFIVACGLRIARPALFDHFFYSPGVRVMSRSSHPSPRPLRLPHLKFDCCVGRAGRVPIDLGLVASIMVIDSGPHPPGDARDFIHRAIRGNHVIPWCWFGHRLGVTKKHTHESAFLPPKEHLKTRKGPRIWPYFCRPFA